MLFCLLPNIFLIIINIFFFVYINYRFQRELKTPIEISQIVISMSQIEGTHMQLTCVLNYSDFFVRPQPNIAYSPLVMTKYTS